MYWYIKKKFCWEKIDVGQHDQLVNFLACHDQDAILAAHCLLTSRYFEP